MSLIPGVVLAEQPAGDGAGLTRPPGSRRTVAHFGFEPDPNNPTDLPLGWIRAQNDPEIPRDRPGFPSWNLAHSSDAAAYAGEAALRLPTRGGSTSLRLRAGVIPVFPGADYAIAAMVRTDGLEHAAARLDARLLDDRGRRIDGASVASELIRGTNWTQVVVMLRGGSAEAAYMQLECLLLQPGADAGGGPVPRVAGGDALPDRFRIREQDYSGSAWFDELTVIQTPRVRLGVDAPANLFEFPAAPAFGVYVRDLAGQQLSIGVEVADDRGRVVSRSSYNTAGGRFERRIEPELPGLGWYRAVVRVSARGEVIDADAVDFGWLPERDRRLLPAAAGGSSGPGGTEDRARFGAVLTALDPAGHGDVLEAAAKLGLGHAVLPALTRGMERDGVRDHAEELMPLIDGLRRRGTSVAASIGPLPDALAVAAERSPTDGEGWVQTPQEVWEPWIMPLLDVLGQRVRRWQLGTTTDPPSPGTHRGAPIERLERTFARLVPGPSLRPVRSAAAPFDPMLAAAPRGRTVVVPAGLGDDGLLQLAEEWRRAAERTAPSARTEEPQVLSVVLNADMIAGEPLHRSLERLARRVVVLWASAVGPEAARTDRPGVRLLVQDPLTRRGPNRDGAMPDAAGVVWRSLFDRLADRRHAATLDLAPGVRAEAFEPLTPGRGALLVLWRKTPPVETGLGGSAGAARSEAGLVRTRLAAGPVERVDLFGNRVTLEPRPYGRSGALLHEVAVGRGPVFIEGVDVELLRFQSSIRLDPPELLAKGGELQHDLVIENPWTRAVRGRYFLVSPGGVAGDRAGSGWRITPRFGDLTLPPTGERRIPLRMTVSPAVQTGPQRFVLEVDLSGRTEYGLIRVEREAELGLPNVRLDVAHRRTAEDGTLLVEARVTNTGDDPIGIDLLARVPGYPRERRTIAGIGPGETVTRVFPFRRREDVEDGAAGPRAAHVAVVLLDGGGRLRRSIRIDAGDDGP